MLKNKQPNTVRQSQVPWAKDRKRARKGPRVWKENATFYGDNKDCRSLAPSLEPVDGPCSPVFVHSFTFYWAPSLPLSSKMQIFIMKISLCSVSVPSAEDYLDRWVDRYTRCLQSLRCLQGIRHWMQGPRELLGPAPNQVRNNGGLHGLSGC